MKKIIITVVLVTALLGGSSYYYVMYGGARDIRSEATAFIVKANSIEHEFSNNIERANKKYLEKPITIIGNVSSINGTRLTLNHSIVCSLNSPISVKKDQHIAIKGRVVGYDDLLDELQLDQCFMINNQANEN